jgi:hypothetical protein
MSRVGHWLSVLFFILSNQARGLQPLPAFHTLTAMAAWGCLIEALMSLAGLLVIEWHPDRG